VTAELSRWFAGILKKGGQGEREAPISPEMDARVRAAVDTLPVTLFEVDANGIYTCVSGGYINLFGITPAILIGRSIFDFPKFVPGKNVMVRRALAGESVMFTGIWPRGRFMIRLVPRCDAEGRVTAVVGLGLQVAKPADSDRYFDELLEALRQSEARFRAMCDCAPLGICVANSSLELGYVNPALCAILDRQPDELLGRGWEGLLRTDELERLRRSRQQGLSTQLSGVLEFANKSGTSIWTSLRMAAMQDDGELLGYVIVVADITQERAARIAIDGAQQDLRRVIEGSPEGIAVVRDQRWIFVNRALVQTLGYASVNGLLGAAVSEIVHPEDQRHALTLIDGPQGLEAEGDARELRFRSASGEYVLLELRPATLSEFEGAPAILISARDITEKKKLQARLAVTERLLAVGTLAAGVAHEINNPLAAALCNLEWLGTQLSRLGAEGLDGGATSTDHERALLRLAKPVEEAREACGRVQRIVQDLKLLSRADEERLGPVEITQIIDSAVRMAWNGLRLRARLVREYGDVPLVHGSEARLAQVFLNLLINATQALPEGDAIANEVRITARALPSSDVLVEVRDTGAGIPEEILGRIFDPFFTTKPPGVGTGLGLSICQRLLTGMGGQIEVDSELGRGSTFRVTLQGANALSAQSREPAAPAGVDATPRARLLVIDDDPAVGSALKLVLAEEHDVEVLTSARRALNQLRSGERYDVILCDLMMPELSGMDFHRELKSSHAEIAAQVIFLTGDAFTTGAQEFLHGAENPCLGKPFNWRELRSLISRQLRRAGAQARPDSRSMLRH
jgi:two-component system cell cycle sensor histidine kinase/response regulator CckA